MDELLRDFLTETHESLDTVDVELVRFEQEPNNAEILANIFRLVHTIKGTCGFLGLPRLAALAHAAESLMGRFRDGLPVTQDAVSLILSTLDRIKEILDALEQHQHEPDGADTDLIAQLDAMALAAAAEKTAGTLVYQVLERSLKPGEATLDELERAFRETPGPAPRATQPEIEKAEAKPDAGSEARSDSKSAATDSKVASQSIRVNVDTLEHLMTMVSELVLTRNQLMEMARRHTETEFKAPLQRLSHVTAELQDGVMKTRMQPIGNAWQKLPRLVRDLSADLGKQIELEMQGAETELDRQVLDLIKDPLTHMVRNSVDHGIETPADRRAGGKPERATIRLTARHEGGHIIVEVSDDGRGLNTRKIAAKAMAQRLVTQAELDKMSDTQIQRFIFAAGMSTADTVTNISGRGVGMDVVQSNMDQIGGTIDVKSVPGQGTLFTIKIPLTLAIISALIIETAGERFAIPQVAVMELVRVRAGAEHRIERIKDTPVLRLRNKLLPLIYLRKLLRLGDPAEQEPESGFVVVTQVGHEFFGVVVDRVFHTEEIVVKPMATQLRHIQAFSGNTILGDGAVIMILDPNGIAASFGAVRAAGLGIEAGAENETHAERDKTSLLIFRAGAQSQKAVPLSLVTRLEEIDVRSIESSGDRHLVQYRGHLMPLICPGECVKIKDAGSQPLLVFSDGGRSMALVVDEIVDIVEEEFHIEVGDERPGLLGSAIVKGEATDILDVGHYLPIAFTDWFGSQSSRLEKAPRHLLLVDDSAFFRNMLIPVLRAAGFAVTTASGGQEAYGLIRAGRTFDLIVTDLQMPGMDGVALAKALRADRLAADTPIIALSSMTTPEMIELVRRAGFHDFVAKFDRQGLIAAVKEQAEIRTSRAA